MRKRVLTVAVLLALALPIAVHAGGPLYVAGSGFNSGAAGTPLTWAGGQISYYTDQGDLSTLLHQADANSFVAGAFSLWTSVPTAALAATRAGQLDEDVSGANVTRLGVVLSMPADIQPTSAKPFAIVYDSDGRVIMRCSAAALPRRRIAPTTPWSEDPTASPPTRTLRTRCSSSMEIARALPPTCRCCATPWRA